MRIQLGMKVKDKITGVIGIAVSRTTFLTGCDRITVQPQEVKDGKPVESQWFDEMQLDVVKGGIELNKPESKPGGPPVFGARPPQQR